MQRKVFLLPVFGHHRRQMTCPENVAAPFVLQMKDTTALQLLEQLKRSSTLQHKPCLKVDVFSISDTLRWKYIEIRRILRHLS
jgi:hypothetical protein